MKMNDKHKSASPYAMQVKNWQKTTSIEEKLDLISRLEKDEWIFDTSHDVRCTDIHVHTIRDNADRITESAKSGTKCFFAQQNYHSPIRINSTKNYGYESLTFLLY